MKRFNPLLVQATLILGVLLALLLSMQSQAVPAEAEDVFKADAGMTWPMLPNESIGELSVKFYPHNVSMQQRFITKTLQLNKKNLPQLNQATRFTASAAILIPNLKSLASGIKPIKFRNKKAKTQNLQMSYNIEAKLETLPQALNDEYEQLLARNEVLKTEIAKLDERLDYLQNKLAYLRQVLEKIIDFEEKSTPTPAAQNTVKPAVSASTLPPPVTKQTIKPPLPTAVPPPVSSIPSIPMPPPAVSKIAPPAPAKAEPEKPATKARTLQETIPVENIDRNPAVFELAGFSLLEWIMALLALSLVIVGIQTLSRKRQQRAIAFLTADSIMPKSAKIGQTLGEISIPDIEAELATSFGASTQVDEYKERSILEEAKLLVKNNAVEEAIGHLKWSLRAQPKTAIGVWLYLLSLLRAQNMKEDFERYAFELHQNFNVMTPLWVNHRLEDIVIAENVEAFGHIKREIIKTWPTEQCKRYLLKLVEDNRNGERSGFSPEVIDEMLFLIELQDVRLQLDEFPSSV